MKKITKYVIVFFTAWIALHTLAIFIVGLNDDVDTADIILVFGSKIETNGLPSERLKSRLDRGLDLYDQNYAPLVVVSGGFGVEGYDEASVMKDYLVDRGIPSQDILVDSYGNNTYQTVQNLIKIAEIENVKNIIIVTHYYHVLRAKSALKKAGFATIYTAHAYISLELRDLYSIPREILGYYVYLFKNYDE